MSKLIDNIKRDQKRGPMYQGKPIRKMTVTQLEAAIEDLRNQGFVSHADVRFYLTCDEPNGDGAQMAFEREFDNVMESEPNSDLDRLEAELERRQDIKYDNGSLLEDSMSIY